jgi:hypothetical protein
MSQQVYVKSHHQVNRFQLKVTNLVNSNLVIYINAYFKHQKQNNIKVTNRHCHLQVQLTKLIDCLLQGMNHLTESDDP